jgi:hypothetical protein
MVYPSMLNIFVIVQLSRWLVTWRSVPSAPFASMCRLGAPVPKSSLDTAEVVKALQ